MIQNITLNVNWFCGLETNGPYYAFGAPFLTRDWKGGPFSLHGKLAQGLSLTMRPTRTASPICKFSPQWPETWLSPGFGANILGFFEVLRHVFKNSARFTDIRTRMQRHLQNFIIYFILPKRPFWWTFLFLIEIKSSIALCFFQKIQKLKIRRVDPRPSRKRMKNCWTCLLHQPIFIEWTNSWYYIMYGRYFMYGDIYCTAFN